MLPKERQEEYRRLKRIIEEKEREIRSRKCLVLQKQQKSTNQQNRSVDYGLNIQIPQREYATNEETNIIPQNIVKNHKSINIVKNHKSEMVNKTSVSVISTEEPNNLSPLPRESKNHKSNSSCANVTVGVSVDIETKDCNQIQGTPTEESTFAESSETVSNKTLDTTHKTTTDVSTFVESNSSKTNSYNQVYDTIVPNTTDLSKYLDSNIKQDKICFNEQDISESRNIEYSNQQMTSTTNKEHIFNERQVDNLFSVFN